MKPLPVIFSCLVALLPVSAHAQVSGGDGFVYDEGFDEPKGIGASARSYLPPIQPSAPSPGLSPRRVPGERAPQPRYLPLTCVAVPEGNGDSVMSLDQDACRTSSPEDDEVRRRRRLPSPYELAWLAADRAMSVAQWPRLEIAPNRVGLTGLRSFFWLERAPAPVTASASVPGLVVTAEAHPVRYTWSFGEGRSRSTPHSGRAWSKRRPGNVPHMYERRGRYRVGVAVLWEARWKLGAGAWEHLGYFSNEDSRLYRVRQMVAMLTRAR